MLAERNFRKMQELLAAVTEPEEGEVDEHEVQNHIDFAFMKDFFCTDDQANVMHVDVDPCAKVVTIEGAEKTPAVSAVFAQEKLDLVDDGFVTPLVELVQPTEESRNKLIALIDSQQIYYHGKPVRELVVPPYGADHVMLDYLSNATFPSAPVKLMRNHKKTSHVYGFVEGVTGEDGVIFSVQCWGDTQEYFFLYESTSQRITRVESNVVAWLRRSLAGDWITLTPGLQTSVSVRAVQFTSKPVSSSLMMMDGVFYYVPDQHYLILEVRNGKYLTRDGYEVGLTESPDGYDKVEARTKIVIQRGYGTYATTKSQMHALEKAAIVADLRVMLSAFMEKPVSVMFRRDHDYNTFQHSWNHSIRLLQRIEEVQQRATIKTYTDMVATVLSHMAVHQVWTYEQFMIRLHQQCRKNRYSFRSYKLYRQQTREYNSRVIRYHNKFTGKSYHIFLTTGAAYTLISRIIKEYHQEWGSGQPVVI